MKRIDRKTFLTLSVSAASSLALGCSGEDVPPPVGTGGSGGAGAGTGGSPVGGSGGSAAGTGGTPVAGSGGAAGGSGGMTPVAPNCGTQLKVFISANHMHTMVVTTDDVMAGVDKLYDTTGASNHPHWIKLTAADFAKLMAGGTVRKLACNDEHEHEYIVNCLGIEKPETTNGSLANYCSATRDCGDTNTNFCPELP